MTNPNNALLQQALAALTRSSPHTTSDYAWQPDGWAQQRSDAIASLEAAIAQPEQPDYDTRQFSNLTNQAHGFALPAVLQPVQLTTEEQQILHDLVWIDAVTAQPVQPATKDKGVRNE